MIEYETEKIDMRYNLDSANFSFKSDKGSKIMIW